MDKKTEYMLLGFGAVVLIGGVGYWYYQQQQQAAANAPLSYIAGDPEPIFYNSDAGASTGPTTDSAWLPTVPTVPSGTFTVPTFTLPALPTPETITEPALVTATPYVPPAGQPVSTPTAAPAQFQSILQYPTQTYNSNESIAAASSDGV